MRANVSIQPGSQRAMRGSAAVLSRRVRLTRPLELAGYLGGNAGGPGEALFRIGNLSEMPSQGGESRRDGWFSAGAIGRPHDFFWTERARQHHRRRLCRPRTLLRQLFVIDGNVWTLAGMSAGIDLALAMVEADPGTEIAREIAKKLVVYNRRGGAQPQQSALLDLDARSDRVQSVLADARENLSEKLSVDALAEVAHLSRRHFTRLFKEETGQSPAQAVETLRVEAAWTMIESGRHSTDEIAGDTGFENPERMRRAFVRAFGKPPQAFQRSARRDAL